MPLLYLSNLYSLQSFWLAVMLFQLDFEILKFLHFGINFQIPQDVTLFKQIKVR